MIARHTKRTGSTPKHLSHKLGHRSKRAVLLHRVDLHIAQIGAIQRLKRPDIADGMLRADHRGRVTQRPWPMPCAGAVGRAAVPRHAVKAQIDLVQPRMVRRQIRQPHKGRHTSETRQDGARNRMKKIAHS